MPKKKTDKEFKKEVFDIVGNEYEILDEYKHNKVKIKFKHNLCNKEFLMTPDRFLAGNRCTYCCNHYKYTPKEFKNKIESESNSEYTVLEDYINTYTKIKFKHNKCNNEWCTTPNNFLRGYRCPKCRESKGEKYIAKWLDMRNIKYKKQVIFKDCMDKSLLKFDFKIYINKDNYFLLEYDGRQHFENVYGEAELINQQRRDKIKNIYCKDKNIKLIRISYKDFKNINSILEGVIFHD